MKYAHVACLMLAVCCGCSSGSSRKTPQSPSPGVKDFVEYATGKTSLDAKRQMEDRIEKVQKERERQLEEALKE